MTVSGDFELFLKKLTPKLRGIAYRLNRGFFSLDADDLFQEAVVFLWEGFRGGEFSDKTESYVLQGCYFHLQNYIRTCRDRISRVCLDAPDGDGRSIEERITPAGAHADFLEGLNSRLLAEVICNNGLTAREKKLLPLFAEGLTTRQIGARVGISHVRVVKMKKEIGAKCRKYLDLDIR